MSLSKELFRLPLFLIIFTYLFSIKAERGEAERDEAERDEVFSPTHNTKSTPVLVILDDIWAKLDLDAIGISLEDDKNIAPDENEGSIMQNIAPDENQRSIMQNIDGSSLEKVSTVKSKILLTSRNLDVLCRMDAEKKFECRILSREEAMTLFVRIVGDVVHNPSYKPIANQVVEKCAGLPVAVSTIANTLKGMNLDIWENALRQLKRSNATNIEGMEEGVYSIIELSYERLKEEAQSLFRLCALYRQESFLILLSRKTLPASRN
ncbi:NB-ARC - like 10 [Theobroma cacao]|nr:NB-ARC - like 10 [Theobroma cacao]